MSYHVFWEIPTPSNNHNFSTKLVVFSLDLELQQPLMIIPLPPCPFQHLHLILRKPTAHRLLQFLSRDLALCALLLRCSEPGFEARLHA